MLYEAWPSLFGIYPGSVVTRTSAISLFLLVLCDLQKISSAKPNEDGQSISRFFITRHENGRGPENGRLHSTNIALCVGMVVIMAVLKLFIGLICSVACLIPSGCLPACAQPEF